jgi:hypothetical protein
MPTTHDSLNGMVAVTGKGIKALGYLTWFSIPDESIGLRKLRQALVVHGLPPTLAPKDTKAINVFKRAMREQETREKVWDADERRMTIVETTVAQVSETPADCVYQISRLTRDLKQRVINYPKALTVVFNKSTEELSFKVLGDVPRSEVVPMTEAIESFYEKNSSKVTGAKVRGIVRNYLKSEPDEPRKVEGLSGENLRGKAGGIYFIPAKHVDELTALSEALAEMYPGRAYLHAIPMADSASEREIIRRHHVANTRSEMMEAVQECRDLLRADRERAPRSDVVANQWARFRALQRRAADYTALLGDEAEEIQTMGDMLKKQLDKLI